MSEVMELASYQQELYKKRVNSINPKPPLVKNVCWAFVVGGIICVIGQIIQNFISNEWGLSKPDATAATSAVMIFLGSFFTGLGVYDELGKRAGAGSVVPITGFANSIVASAMEFKREGYVFGVGAKMFTIAGPVIVYGTITAFVVGLVHLLMGRGG